MVSPTPIFDQEVPAPEPPHRRRNLIIAIIVGVVVGVLTILADEYQLQLPPWHWPAFNGLLILPALYLGVAVHELGHLIAGRIVGLETGGLSIGGFVWTKSGNNWTFHFDRRMIALGFFKPLTRTANFKPSRYAWMVAGGPLASLLLLALSGLLFATLGSGEWRWIGSLFWISLVLLILTSLPFTSGLNQSDGALLRRLIQDPESTLCWMALLKLQTDDAAGVRPRDWDHTAMERIKTVDRLAREFFYCQLLWFYKRLDQREYQEALENLENVLSVSARAPKPLRHAIFMEAATSSALIRKNAGQARAWLQRACNIQKPESLEVPNAAIAMLEERFEEAAHHWRAAQDRVVRKKLDSGLIRFAKERWAEYESSCHLLHGNIN